VTAVAPTRAPAARPDPRRTLRAGRFSTVYRRRQLAVPLLVLVVLLLAAAVSLGRGDYPIGVLDVLRVLPALELHGLVEWTGTGWRIAPPPRER